MKSGFASSGQIITAILLDMTRQQAEAMVAEVLAATPILDIHTHLYSPPFGNLGLWHAEGDHAVWSLEVPKDGKYRVEITYACDFGRLAV